MAWLSRLADALASLGSLFLEPFVAGAPVFRPSRTFVYRAFFLGSPPLGTALHSPFARRKLRLGRFSPRGRRFSGAADGR